MSIKATTVTRLQAAMQGLSAQQKAQLAPLLAVITDAIALLNQPEHDALAELRKMVAVSVGGGKVRQPDGSLLPRLSKRDADRLKNLLAAGDSKL